MIINPKELEVLNSIISKSVLLLERGLGRYQRSQRTIPVISLEKVHENDVSSPNINVPTYENDVEVPGLHLSYGIFDDWFFFQCMTQWLRHNSKTCVACHNSFFFFRKIRVHTPQDPDGLSSCSLLKEPPSGGTLWSWLTVRHGIDGPNRNRWFTELKKWWIFPWLCLLVIRWYINLPGNPFHPCRDTRDAKFCCPDPSRGQINFTSSGGTRSSFASDSRRDGGRTPPQHGDNMEDSWG